MTNELTTLSNGEIEKFLREFIYAYQDGEYSYDSPRACIKAFAKKLKIKISQATIIV
jgi:hypothetical protein